ncbi:FxsA family protein [Thioalkalivibrio sp. HK1]|uniref:FxsA family protein n=1 Tax=Thioalkalivibrio sp. HK1 TaxID=1469245 RepID=UPI0004714CBF|nr:FxsA family protein [Thioalkalivibrio sp. HK1]
MNIFHFLIILLIGFPLIEIALLIEVGGSLGVFPTIALVVLTAVVGAMLVRAQGFATLRRARRSMDAGELPAIEMIESVFLLLAGALLLAPGFVTDALGFLCLIPPLRQALIMRLIRSGRLNSHPRTASEPIEGEYRHHDDETTPPALEDANPLEQPRRDRDDIHRPFSKK